MARIIEFTKMHGLGNDFIVINATLQPVNLDSGLIKQLSNRRTGIGFDQLLLIQPSSCNQVDFVYRIFNGDGKEVEQCGNGARCVAHYIFSNNLSQKKTILLDTLSGRIELNQEKNKQITVNMGKPRLSPEQIPFITNITKLEKGVYELELEKDKIEFGVVSMGNPHAVMAVKQVNTAPVERIGKCLQHHDSFPKQVNVGFMEIIANDYIKLRVYERGVGETLACGSGACAAAVIGRLAYNLSATVKVELPGGSLCVNWEGGDNNVYLTGPAVQVFKGEIVV